MTTANETAARSVLGLALKSVSRLQGRIDELEYREPIAIVGFAFVLPGGVEDEGTLWQTLMQGASVVAPRAAWLTGEKFDRPELQFGTVENPRCFDHAFFRIAGAEAELMDVQQRMLLDTTWRAFEHAGLPVETLKGSATGVFFGMCGSDFDDTLTDIDDAAAPFAATGLAGSVAAGRISHAFGFSGPALVVDTACSSSLMATTLACTALRNAECNIAVAGGSNILCGPRSTKALDALGVLSRSGLCAPFSADANGFVRGEGCVVVVLKRLGDARRDGDRIWSVIRGWAVNHDGTAASLTAPSRRAQETLIQRALDHAGVKPADVQFVEAHGTGTPLGDPIELGGLSTVFGRRERPLLVTSSKGNFGHLEAAAGTLGLIKAALSLDQNLLPPSANGQPLSGYFEWNKASLIVPNEPVPLSGDMAAGVSSFGFSGTNVHVVLEAGPRSTEIFDEQESADLFLMTAPSEPELGYLVEQAVGLRHEGSDLSAICTSSRSRRSPLSHRVAAVGCSWQDISDDLRRRMSRRRDVSPARHGQDGPAVIRVFSGQGMQFPGMGLGLMRRFKQVGDVVAEAADTLADCGVDLMAGFGATEAERYLGRGAWLQPALVCLQVGIDRLLTEALGAPELVIGHSLGEISAAISSGALRFADGIRLACHRGQASDLVSKTGSLCVVSLDPDETQTLMNQAGNELWIAVVNGSKQTVVGGSSRALAALEQLATNRNVRFVRLSGHWPFHTPLMSIAADHLRREVGSIVTRNVPCRMVSTLTGTEIGGQALDLDYWCEQLVLPVRFDHALAIALKGQGASLIEVGVHPVLSAVQAGPGVSWHATARREERDGVALLRLLGDWFECGRGVNWSALGENKPFQSSPIPRISRRLDLRTSAAQYQAPKLAVDMLDTVSELMGVDLRHLASDASLDQIGVSSLALIAVRELVPPVFRERLSIATTVGELRAMHAEALIAVQSDPLGASPPPVPITDVVPARDPVREPPFHRFIDLAPEKREDTCWTDQVRRRWRKDAGRLLDIARCREELGQADFILLHLLDEKLDFDREAEHARALALMVGANVAVQGLSKDRRALVDHILGKREAIIVVVAQEQDIPIEVIRLEAQHA